MSKFIEVNDLSPTKDKDVDDFLNDPSLFGNDTNITTLESDADYDGLFTALVKEKQPETFSAFQDQVGDLFNHKLDNKLER